MIGILEQQDSAYGRLCKRCQQKYSDMSLQTILTQSALFNKNHLFAGFGAHAMPVSSVETQKRDLRALNLFQPRRAAVEIRYPQT